MPKVTGLGFPGLQIKPTFIAMVARLKINYGYQLNVRIRMWQYITHGACRFWSAETRRVVKLKTAISIRIQKRIPANMLWDRMDIDRRIAAAAEKLGSPKNNNRVLGFTYIPHSE